MHVEIKESSREKEYRIRFSDLHLITKLEVFKSKIALAVRNVEIRLYCREHRDTNTTIVLFLYYIKFYILDC